jgi:hypothetical protein
MQNYFMGCAVCGRPLRLAESKTENGGLPAHEECCQLRLKLKQVTMPPAKESANPPHFPANKSLY